MQGSYNTLAPTSGLHLEGIISPTYLVNVVLSVTCIYLLKIGVG